MEDSMQVGAVIIAFDQLLRRKKKARITNRQAKIRQKKKKPTKQTNTKYKRLQQTVEKEFKQKGISTEAIEFRESPDGVKMSEVILKLAEPLLKKYGDIDKRIRTIISLTIFEWNRLMLPDGEREKYQDKMMDTLLPPDENAETVGSILYLSDLIAERQKKYFPDIKKVIVDYELILSGGDITLNVSSAPIESNSKPKQIST
jgi:hypothetical protein